MGLVDNGEPLITVAGRLLGEPSGKADAAVIDMEGDTIVSTAEIPIVPCVVVVDVTGVPPR